MHPTSTQEINGFPCIPRVQKQTALWYSALHLALLPHKILKHGSLHSFSLHCLSKGQSSSAMHSSIIFEYLPLFYVMKVRYIKSTFIVLKKIWLRFTYTYSIPHEAYQPIQVGIDTLVYVQTLHIKRFDRKVRLIYMDLGNGCRHKPSGLGILYHADILLL